MQRDVTDQGGAQMERARHDRCTDDEIRGESTEMGGEDGGRGRQRRHGLRRRQRRDGQRRRSDSDGSDSDSDGSDS